MTNSSNEDDPFEQMWLEVYSRSDAKFRDCGVDEYLERSQLTRLDFGLITLASRDHNSTLARFLELFCELVVFPGMLDDQLRPPVGNPSSDEIRLALDRLLERGVLRVALPEDVAYAEERIRSGVVVFPGVKAPETGSVVLGDEGQRAWLHVYHGLFGNYSECRDDREKRSEQVVEYFTHPPEGENDRCNTVISVPGYIGPNSTDRILIEDVGPVMDYWWHIAPRGYRRTITRAKSLRNSAQSTPDSVLDECEPIIRGDRDQDLDQLAESPRLGVAIHAAWRHLARSARFYDMPSERIDEFCQFLSSRLVVEIPKWWSVGLVGKYGAPSARQARRREGESGNANIQVSEESLQIACGGVQVTLLFSDLSSIRRKKRKIHPFADRFAACECDGSIAVVFSSDSNMAIEYVIASVDGESGRVEWRQVIPKCSVYHYIGKSGNAVCSVTSAKGYIGVFGVPLFGCGYILGIFQTNGDCVCLFNTEMYDLVSEHQEPRINPLEWKAPDYE